MFALAAAVVALLAILDVATKADLLWWWLGFIALHLAFSIGIPWPRKG